MICLLIIYYWIIMKRKQISTYLDELDNNGYCIVPNVLTNKESDYYIQEIWKWLENLGVNIKRDNQSTWSDSNWPSVGKNLIQNYNIGHAQFLWDLRCHEEVIKVYQELWNTSDLLVSFDGIGIARPVSVTGVLDDTPWWHIDQSFNKIGRHCIQGFVNLEESKEGDACFSAIVKSHKYHQELCDTFNIEKLDIDWYELDQDEINWYFETKKLKSVKVYPPKGSMVLWDSRTIHCNFPNKTDNMRYVAYISMTPAEWIDSENLKKKKYAFENLYTTAHWPHDITMFTKYPPGDKLKSKVKLNNKLPKLTLTGKRLAGLLPYNKKSK
jgi:ectoine hydroxylase-related dioxygenase (phytanoyl-CoA dioxygenase family)